LRLGLGRAGLLILASLLPWVSASADFDGYIVRIHRGRPNSVSEIGLAGNAGVYLGDGLVLTAAHVAGKPDGTSLFVVAGDQFVPAKFIKAGRSEQTDISLLAVDPAGLPPDLRSHPSPDLCASRLEPGWTVAVASFGRVDRSTIVSPAEMPSSLPARFDSLIKGVDMSGESGSGVFDPVRDCLAGIISRRIQIIPDNSPGGPPIGLAKYFVPADEIRAFVGASLPPARH